jgi:thiol-disulfide isomerase/thioredoxin
MRFLLMTYSLLFLVTCASTGRSGVVARRCGRTDVQVNELEQFGFTLPKNKLAVVRIFATWCPYCKEDLDEIAKRFKNGTWSESNVAILLMTYHNRREDKFSYDDFLKEKLPKIGIPESAVQVVYIDKSAEELGKIKGGDGKSLFEGWKGVPFGLVFGKDGRLIFRGHFTMGPQVQDAHYNLITDRSTETCH